MSSINVNGQSEPLRVGDIVIPQDGSAYLTDDGTPHISRGAVESRVACLSDIVPDHTWVEIAAERPGGKRYLFHASDLQFVRHAQVAHADYFDDSSLSPNWKPFDPPKRWPLFPAGAWVRPTREKGYVHDITGTYAICHAPDHPHGAWRVLGTFVPGDRSCPTVTLETPGGTRTFYVDGFEQVAQDIAGAWCPVLIEHWTSDGREGITVTSTPYTEQELRAVETLKRALDAAKNVVVTSELRTEEEQTRLREETRLRAEKRMRRTKTLSYNAAASGVPMAQFDIEALRERAAATGATLPLSLDTSREPIDWSTSFDEFYDDHLPRSRKL